VTPKLTNDTYLRLLAWFAVMFGVVQVALELNRYDWPTGDEYWHYSYSERLWNTGVTERATIHNYNSTTPSALLNLLSQRTYSAVTEDKGTNKIALRLPGLMWYLVLLSGVFAFASKFFGKNAASVALGLTALDPNLQAHAGLIGTDLPFAAVTVLVMLFAVRYYERPAPQRAIGLGLIIGLAFLVKYSAAFLVFPVGILFLYANFIQKTRKQAILSVLAQLPILLVLVALVINVGYGFIGFGETFSDRNWYYPFFVDLAKWIPQVPLPLPIDFISGFDHQLAAERTWDWNGILLGHELRSGVWYFFLLSWLIKTPLALVAVSAFAIFSGVKSNQSWTENPAFLFCLALFLYFFLYFSLVFRVHIGIRYVLMCLPLAYLLISAPITRYPVSWKFVTVASAVVALSLLEIRPYLGNGLAFTNLIVWPKQEVYKWIADSNVDWNQNHRSAREQANSQLGNYVFNPPHIVRGYNLFTVNSLAGVYRNFEQHRWPRWNLDPVGHFGFTTILFNVSDTEFDEFLIAERTYSAPQSSMGICREEAGEKSLVNDTLPVLKGTWSDPKIYTACLYVEKPLLVEVKLDQGRAGVGLYVSENNCQATEAGAGESLWFRLEEGMHPVCARVLQDFSGSWTVHAGSAKWALGQPVGQ